MMDSRDNMQKCQEYVHQLEKEREKIIVFQRELPHSLELVTRAIEACKQQLSGPTTPTTMTEYFNECSEKTTSTGPVLEEFIPIKTHDHDLDIDDDQEDDHECNKPQNNIIENFGKKSDWLRSVQLWSNQTPDPSTNQKDDEEPKKIAIVEVKKNGGGAFHPFQREKNRDIENVNINININEDDSNISKPKSLPTVSACSSDEAVVKDGLRSKSGSGSESKKGDKSEHSLRKSRRCWSPELHRRFLHALQQLGGSHAATPKQIRELMKVDGLTNDEVKSHLQKYRLHTRRPNSSAQPTTTPPTTQPHFVVVGGLWMSPQDYSSSVRKSGDTTTALSPNHIYAPVATVATPSPHPQTSTVVTPRQFQPNISSYSSCGDRRSPSSNNSPSTSSSTHTTTASRPC